MDKIIKNSIPIETKQSSIFNCSGIKHNKSPPANQETFLTPKCQDHHYCEICIQNKKSTPKNCETCKKFFENMKFKFFRRKDICNLCGIKDTNQILGCTSHYYCKICFIHILNNRIDIYKRISKCSKCLTSIPKFKEIFCINNSKNLINDATANILIKETLDKIFESTQIIKAKKVFESGLIERIENEKIFIKDQNIILNQPNIIYSTFKEPGSESVKISFFEDPHCVICQSIRFVIGFLCNHNICKDCYLTFCIRQIEEFFVKKRKGNVDFSQSFYYYCEVNGCGGKIDVPTSMVIKEIKRRRIDIEIDEYLQYFDGLV